MPSVLGFGDQSTYAPLKYRYVPPEYSITGDRCMQRLVLPIFQPQALDPGFRVESGNSIGSNSIEPVVRVSVQ